MTTLADLDSVLERFSEIAPKGSFRTKEERVYGGMERIIEECDRIREEEHDAKMRKFNERAKNEEWGLIKRLFAERPAIRSYVTARELYELCVRVGLTENIANAARFIDSLSTSILFPHIYGGFRDEGISIVKSEDGLGNRRYNVLMARFNPLDC